MVGVLFVVFWIGVVLVVDLFSFVNDNLSKFREIKSQNELGDCHEVAVDVMRVLSDFCPVMVCLYSVDKSELPGYGFVEPYSRFDLRDFYTIENGKLEFYAVHYVVCVDSFVIDLNIPVDIVSYRDIVCTFDDWFARMKSINSYDSGAVLVVARENGR